MMTSSSSPNRIHHHQHHLPNDVMMTSHPAAGVHFRTDEESLKEEIGRAMTVYSHGLELLYKDRAAADLTMNPALSCTGRGTSRWAEGERFFR